MKKYPMSNDRLGWHKYYVGRFNKDPSNWQAEQLAMWYLILHHAFSTAPVDNNIRFVHMDIPIDWSVLEKQREYIAFLTSETGKLDPKKIDLLEGVLCLLDSVFDADPTPKETLCD